MTIRPATEKDIPCVSDIYEKIHDSEMSGMISTGWVRGVYPTSVTAENAFLRKDLFVGESGGIIVGAVILNHLQVDCYYGADWKYPCDESEVMVMHTLVIDPDESNKGYGSAFVKFYEDYARKNKCKALRFDTQEKNKAARKFYKKLGFKEIGKAPCVFNGIPGVMLVLLEKPLYQLQ